MPLHWQGLRLVARLYISPDMGWHFQVKEHRMKEEKNASETRNKVSKTRGRHRLDNVRAAERLKRELMEDAESWSPDRETQVKDKAVKQDDTLDGGTRQTRTGRREQQRFSSSPLSQEMVAHECSCNMDRGACDQRGTVRSCDSTRK